MLPRSIEVKTTVRPIDLIGMPMIDCVGRANFTRLERLVRRNRDLRELLDANKFEELREQIYEVLEGTENYPRFFVEFINDYTAMELVLGHPARPDSRFTFGRESLKAAEDRKGRFPKSPRPSAYGVLEFTLKFRRASTRLMWGEVVLGHMAATKANHPVLINGDAFRVGPAYSAMLLDTAGCSAQADELWDIAREWGWEYAHWDMK